MEMTNDTQKVYAVTWTDQWGYCGIDSVSSTFDKAKLKLLEIIMQYGSEDYENQATIKECSMGVQCGVPYAYVTLVNQDVYPESGKTFDRTTYYEIKCYDVE